VLGLIAVVGLLSAGALHDALFGQQLATSRVLQQRADALAQWGVEDAMARLEAQTTPAAQHYALRPVPSSGDSISVDVRHVGASTLPSGHSSASLVRHDFAIESTGHTARGIHVTLVQGATRVLPATPVRSTGAQP
jgi:hypothetical protein